MCHRQDLREDHVYDVADHAIVPDWIFRGFADRSQQALPAGISKATERGKSGKKKNQGEARIFEGARNPRERKELGRELLVAVTGRLSRRSYESLNTVLKPRVCVYVIRAYVFESAHANRETKHKVMHITQFPDGPERS